MLGMFFGRPEAPGIDGRRRPVLLAVNPALVYAIGFQLSVAATAGMSDPRHALRRAPPVLPARPGPRRRHHPGRPGRSHARHPVPLRVGPHGHDPGQPPRLRRRGARHAPGPASPPPSASPSRPLDVLVGDARPNPPRYLLALGDAHGATPRSLRDFAGREPAGSRARPRPGRRGAWWLRSGRRLPRRAKVAVLALGPLFAVGPGHAAGPPGRSDRDLLRRRPRRRRPDPLPGRGGRSSIDAGPDSELVAAKLAALGIRRIDLVVATHPHADHVSRIPGRRWPDSRRPWSSTRGCSSDAPYYADFVRAVRASGCPGSAPHPRCCTVADVRLEVLARTAAIRGRARTPTTTRSSSG